jgi:hypothetical protein
VLQFVPLPGRFFDSLAFASATAVSGSAISRRASAARPSQKATTARVSGAGQEAPVRRSLQPRLLAAVDDHRRLRTAAAGIVAVRSTASSS